MTLKIPNVTTFVKVILKGDLKIVKNLITGSLRSPSKTVLASLALKIDNIALRNYAIRYYHS